MGDSIGANLLMMGFAWQQGAIPLSREALERAIELNGVAVPMNHVAFGLGRLAAANPAALERFLGLVKTDNVAEQALPDINALVARRSQFLADYQNAEYASRYRTLVEKVRRAERECVGLDSPLRLTAVVARYYSKLLAYKDEYEVARLYTNGEFARQLHAQFEGDFKIEFHMAPPLLSRPDKQGGNPRKMKFGGWMWSALKLVAKAKGLRGTPFDAFGYTLERRMERELARDYADTMEAILPKLTRENLQLVEEFAALPEHIRGYGHIKIRNVRQAKQQESKLLQQLGVEIRMGDAICRALQNTEAKSSLSTIPIVVSR